jgi:hypothetical protein
MPRIFKLLIGEVFTERELEDFFSLTIKAHNNLVRYTGVKQATKDWKTITTYCNLLLEGRKPGELHRVSVGKTDRWPKLFSHLRPIYHRITSPKQYNLSIGQIAELRRLCLTLFKVNRVCYDFVDLDVSGLTQTHEIPKEVEEMFIEHLHLTTDPVEELDLLRALPFISPANGPNSLPKLESVGAEAAALRISPIYKHILRYSELTDNMSVIQYINICADAYIDANGDEDLESVALRKLVAIPDKGNKARVIAICDFFTQSLLSSLESVIIRELHSELPGRSAFFSHQ